MAELGGFLKVFRNPPDQGGFENGTLVVLAKKCEKPGPWWFEKTNDSRDILYSSPQGDAEIAAHVRATGVVLQESAPLRRNPHGRVKFTWAPHTLPPVYARKDS